MPYNSKTLSKSHRVLESVRQPDQLERAESVTKSDQDDLHLFMELPMKDCQRPEPVSHRLPDRVCSRSMKSRSCCRQAGGRRRPSRGCRSRTLKSHDRIRCRGTSRLPCLFYVHSPERHVYCAGTVFQNLQDLKSHLWTSHRRPFNCPICHGIFNTARDRDRHIRSANCTLRDSPGIDGVADEDVLQLARRPDPSLPPQEQWMVLWDTVFPGVERPALSAQFC